jgi:HSP20 family molecular chaperone IbpA
MEVLDAIAKDGILTVRLERRLPEAMKPKAIAITYQS